MAKRKDHSKQVVASDNPFASALSQALGVVVPEPNDTKHEVASQVGDEQSSQPMHGQVGILRERCNGRWVVSLNFESTHGGNLNDVASQLKKSLSVGGSLKSGVLLLQGDIREKVEQHLDRMGLTYKRTGG